MTLPQPFWSCTGATLWIMSRCHQTLSPALTLPDATRAFQAVTAAQTSVKPKLVVCALIENGGFGAEAAAPAGVQVVWVQVPDAQYEARLAGLCLGAFDGVGHVVEVESLPDDPEDERYWLWRDPKKRTGPVDHTKAGAKALVR